jgi:hypothetical protein
VTRSGSRSTKHDILRLVIVRGPDGNEPEDIFVTTGPT